MGIFDLKTLGQKHAANVEMPKKSIPPVKEFLPVFYPELEGYPMNMHTDSGEKYCFNLTGLKLYHPNMGGSCGYGSDDWYFHCKYNGEDYILRFSDDAGYGTMWECASITKENAGQLKKLSAAKWDAFVMGAKNRRSRLHPDTIDAAKEIVQDTSSRCGPISDQGFYGQ